MSPINIGWEIEIVDELAPVVAPTATDPCFLLHSAADEVVTVNSAAEAREEFEAEPALVALSDAFFGEGGAKLTVVPLDIGSGGSGSGGDIEEALELLPADLGPGQVVVPEVNTGPEMEAIANWAYATNRIYLADGPDGASNAALQALGATLRGATGARFAALEADTLLIPGVTSGTTREVPASIVKAGLIARSDIATGNPNLAAAGLTNGRCRYVIGIDVERTETERNLLAESGVNCFRTLYSTAVVPYGYRTVADPDDLPIWWDLSGSRTTMAIRARVGVVAEFHEFGNVDGQGVFLASLEAGVAREMKGLQDVGALFALGTSPGYSVDAGWGVNPRSELAQGRIRVRITFRTSGLAEHITLTIIRRPLTEEV